MAKTKTKAEAKPKILAKTKKPSYWIHVPLLEAIEKHIQAGILAKSSAGKSGLDFLFAEIVKEFKPFFDEGGHKFTKFSLKSKLSELVWNKERHKQIETYVRENRDVDDITKRFPYLPKQALDAKIRHFRGRGNAKTPAQHVRGIFRIIPDGVVVKPLKMPETSLANPIVIPDSVKAVLPVGAPMLGLPYPGTMSENKFRCLMELAERMNLAVVLTGGLLHLNVKQMHANTRNKNARASALDLDLDILNPLYRPVAEEIMKSGEDTPIYTTFIENFENVRSALKGKIFCHSQESGSKPRFSFPLYFQLGASEIEFITACATSEIRHQNNKRFRELGGELRKQRAFLRADEDDEDAKREIERLLDEVDRTIQTYVSDDNHRRAYERMRSYIVGKLLDAMPGAQLIGSAESWLSFKGKTLHFKEAGSDKLCGNLLDTYIQTEGNHLTQGGELADIEILVNRWNLHPSGSLLDNSKYNVPHSSLVLSLPPAIDGDYIRRAYKKSDLITKSTPVERFIGSPYFKSGAIAIRINSGLVSLFQFSMEAIQYWGGPLEKRNKNRDKDLWKFFTIGATSDLHSGHPWEWHVWNKSVNGKPGRHLDLTSAIMNIERECGGIGRTHAYWIPDDLTQGDNFSNHVQPHENMLSTEQLRKEIASFRELIRKARSAGNHSEVERLEDELYRCILFQNIVKGEYRIENQLRKLIYGVFADNIDMWASFIAAFKRSGVEYKGPSKLKEHTHDEGDLPVIALAHGNHFGHSFGDKSKCHLTEGFIAAEAVKPRIALELPKQYHEEVLQDRSPMIGTPLQGQEFVGLTVLDTKKGGKYGLHVRGSPARKGPANGFGLEAAAKNAISRGNHNGCFGDVDTEVQMTGDIHKGGFVIIDKYVHVSCPAATKGDPYSIRGFARSHVGGVKISLPAVGVNYAPVVITFVPEAWVSEWYEKRFPVDFTKIIPDPL